MPEVGIARTDERPATEVGRNQQRIIDPLNADSQKSYPRGMSSDAARLLREARTRAGLTQKELAKRARTAQSVIVRIERGQSDPSWQTLKRLIGAAGFTLQGEITLGSISDSHMLQDVARILSLTPEERLAEVRNVNALAVAAHLPRRNRPKHR